VASILNKFSKFIWVAFIIGVIIAVLTMIFIASTKMPDTEELENPSYELSTLIYSADMEELGRYFKFNRENVRYETLNPHIINALVSTEDERFFSHSGIDVKSLTRALVYLGKKGGASTITQQLAKLFFTERSSNIIERIWQKLKEWVIAVEFEKRYTKEEIMAMYLNKFDFLYNSYGVSPAATTYFQKKQSELNVEEAAVLVGMLKNPSLYNPKKFPENAQKRRNVVLYQMVKNGKLSREEFDTLKVKPIDASKFQRTIHYDGVAPYFRATLTTYLKELLDDPRYKKPDGTKYNIYEDGLTIYTTIDMKMQEHAEAAVTAHMAKLQDRYFNWWKGKDPWTYKAEPAIKEIRKDGLDRLVRESERFGNLKQTYMNKVSQEVLNKYPDARMWDSDILRMRKADKDPKYLPKLLKEGYINKNQKTAYESVLNDDIWISVKTQWARLNQNVDKVFGQTKNMVVYDYNTGGERTVSMTPMDSIRYHRMHMQLGSVSIDPRNGEVKTWIGGISNKYFKYDHVLADRQVGSTFKPFVYATAISQQAISPCLKVDDIQYTIPAGDANFGLLKSWSPSNARGKFTGNKMTLMDGLKTSTNSISVWLMMQLGSPELVRNLASEMGVEKDKIPSAPSICLGATNLNVLEMTGAYSTFANNGVYQKPVFVKQIVDKNGKVIYQSTPDRKRVMHEKYNYVMVEMLKYAASSRQSWLETDFGGKTGTTNDYVDGWFMGITPELVTGTWVGGEDQWIKFETLEDGQGGVMARPYFLDFMKRVESDETIDYDEEALFAVPDGDLIEMDCSKYSRYREEYDTGTTDVTTSASDSTGTTSQEDDKPRFKKVVPVEDEFEEDF